jgi:ribonuclease HI
VSSRTVIDCLSTIQAILTRFSLHMVWVKAHAGNPGNETADALAKLGAKEPRPIKGPGPFQTVPPSFVKAQLLSHAIAEWNEWWQHRQPCRQTKLVFKEVDLQKSKKIITHNRKEIGLFIRWFTGHNFLRYHRSLLDPSGQTSPLCRLCGKEAETAHHILFECVELADERLLILNIRPGEVPNFNDIPLSNILSFIETYSEVLEADSTTHSVQMPDSLPPSPQ